MNYTKKEMDAVLFGYELGTQLYKKWQQMMPDERGAALVASFTAYALTKRD